MVELVWLRCAVRVMVPRRMHQRPTMIGRRRARETCEQSRSIITGKDGRARGSDEGSKQISATIGKALRSLILSKAECID
jgi:hypothetical protein